MPANFSTTESKYIGLFPNTWISLTYRTYRGSVFLLINEEISDKLWESALADPFQFTIYSRQKASLSRYGAREDASYYKAMYTLFFYKNVEAEICPNFKNMLRTYPRLRVGERLYFAHLF